MLPKPLPRIKPETWRKRALAKIKLIAKLVKHEMSESEEDAWKSEIEKMNIDALDVWLPTLDMQIYFYSGGRIEE